MEKQGKKDKETSSSPIILTKFERVTKKVQEKKEKMAYGLFKLKVTVQGVKALAQAKKETKLKERKELLNKVEKVTLSVKKGKAKKTHSEEYDKEMEKELEDESPLDDEVAKPSKKKKVTIKKKVLNMQFVERQERFSK